MTAAGDLLARVGEGFFQQAFVVADMDAAQNALTTTIGCGPFTLLPAADHDFELRGAPIKCALELGFARCGNVQIELLRPVRGEGLHVEFLAQHGPGAHHLGFMVDDLDAEIAAAGFPKLQGGQFGTLRFCYLDTWEAIGSYVELVEDPDAMLWTLMPWR